jgi:hypothetical protein
MPKRKNKTAQIVFSTAVSGCPRKSVLDKVEQISADNGYKVKTYHLGAMLIQFMHDSGFRIDPIKVLRVDPKIRNLARCGAFERLLGMISRDKYRYDALIVSAHTVFYWDGLFTPAESPFYLPRIDPEFFVCYIDSAMSILNNLKCREDWQEQSIRERDVWGWQNEEYNNTNRMAEYLNLITGKHAPLYAIPTGQRPETLYYLLFEPERPIAYAQSPMTLLSAKDRKIVFRGIDEMWKRFIVFNPWAIETGAIYKNDSTEDRIRHSHTKYRDLKWYIGQSDICIARYPKVVSSPGVEQEIKEGVDTGKDCFITWPEKKSSPFHDAMKYIAWDDKELFEYFDNVYLPAHYRKRGKRYKPPK